jgi:hypothetical protein
MTELITPISAGINPKVFGSGSEDRYYMIQTTSLLWAYPRYHPTSVNVKGDILPSEGSHHRNGGGID